MSRQRVMAGDTGFCRSCGGWLEWRDVRGDEPSRRVCRSCGDVDYRQPKLAAGVVIVEHGRVLLTRRGVEPYCGLLCLPAGFVEEDEGTVACAEREAREETGLQVTTGPVFGVYDYTDDPRGRGTLVLYDARITGGEERAGDDASELRWLAIQELDERRIEAEIAFRQHRSAIRTLRDRRPGAAADAWHDREV